MICTNGWDHTFESFFYDNQTSRYSVMLDKNGTTEELYKNGTTFLDSQGDRGAISTG